MNRRICLGCALLLVFSLCFSSMTARAALQGASVGIFSISPCPSFCGGPGGTSGSAFDGGEGEISAYTSLSDVRGNGQAIVSLAGQLLLPVLGSESFSNSNSQVSSDATGMMSYDYTGAASTTIDLDFALEGSTSILGTNTSDAFAQASVVVMKSNDFPFSTSFGTLVFELLSPEELVGYQQVNLSSNAALQTVGGSVSIDLEPGDRIAVWAQIITRATRGGSADAFDTLTMNFSDTSGLAPVTVPSPSSGLLSMIALGFLSMVRRPNI